MRIQDDQQLPNWIRRGSLGELTYQSLCTPDPEELSLLLRRASWALTSIVFEEVYKRARELRYEISPELLYVSSGLPNRVLRILWAQWAFTDQDVAVLPTDTLLKIVQDAGSSRRGDVLRLARYIDHKALSNGHASAEEHYRRILRDERNQRRREQHIPKLALGNRHLGRLLKKLKLRTAKQVLEYLNRKTNAPQKSESNDSSREQRRMSAEVRGTRVALIYCLWRWQRSFDNLPLADPIGTFVFRKKRRKFWLRKGKRKK